MRELPSTPEQSKLKLFNQIWLCSEAYKKIFASILNGAVIPVGDYLAEVLMLEEMLAPYADKMKDQSKYDYLKPVFEVRKYHTQPQTIRVRLETKDGKWLMVGNPKDESQRGKNRQELVAEFEQTRQALNKFAFDLGLVDLKANYDAGMSGV